MESSSLRHKRTARTRKRSFTEALKEKYASEETWDTDACEIEIVLIGKPTIKAGDAELSFLKNVVLNQCSVSHAGIPPEGLASLCPNVIDLDLSNNLIESWKDVIPIMSELPHLKFVNLSKNKIKNYDNFLENWTKDVVNVENLVLNDTAASWKEVMKIAKLMPHLKELHICRNGYCKTEDVDLDALDSVECLRLNENRFTRWEEIWRLRTLTNMKSLILSGNPLLDIYYKKPSADTEQTDVNDICTCPTTKIRRKSYESPQKSAAEQERGRNSSGDSERDMGDSGNSSYEADDEEDEENPSVVDFVEDLMSNVAEKLTLEASASATATSSGSALNYNKWGEQGCGKCGKLLRKLLEPFVNVKLLCVSETLISTWEDLHAVSRFPKLESLRIKDVSLLCHMDPEERRKLFLASLPNIQLLNGSEVMPTEREKAERQFVRYFSKMKRKPPRYDELQKKHGKLRPLVDVDLGFNLPKYATLTFIYKGLPVHEGTVYVLDSVGKLRVYVSQQLLKPISSFRMYHRACGEGHKEKGTIEELRLDSLPMSRYDFMDGDEIHIDDNS
ncbi:tubulin-specific chaperone cofactor E-like protein [Tubulanus polymorphus]|uniref:tubulin-specific chaperone cofactor E-like protein n=1 Tax=Tubulanus polymorphus TaxID=672921 RepID=UPI003DA34B10